MLSLGSLRELNARARPQPAYAIQLENAAEIFLQLLVGKALALWVVASD